MTPKPDAHIIPTQDEFDAWCQHPVTQFVAEAYRVAAEKQRAAWDGQFDKPLYPTNADFSYYRLELKTREDAYRSILENTLPDYIAIHSQEESHGRRPTGARTARSG